MMSNKAFKLEIDEAVASFRQLNGYSSYEPIQLTSFLMKNNVTVAYVSLSDKFDGMSIRTQKDLKFMLINREKTVGRQHFTIGHEIYHLFVQKDFRSHKCNILAPNDKSNIEEQKANYFSACLLLPYIGVSQLIPEEERGKNKLKISTLFKIQQYYRLSISAVINRLVELKFIDNTYSELFNGNIKSTANKLGYDMYLFEKRKEDKIIGNYASIASELFQNRKISESFYFELLNAVNIDPLDIKEDGVQ